MASTIYAHNLNTYDLEYYKMVATQNSRTKARWLVCWYKRARVVAIMNYSITVSRKQA
jgi:hypothetical protein